LERRDARKRACPVWGALGGNLPLRGGKAPSFDSIYVAKKTNQRWLWHAIDHHTGKVLAYVFGRRKDKVFLRLQALLEPFGITRYYTDGWGTYERHVDTAKHTVGKAYMQRIESKHINLRTRIKRLVRLKHPRLLPHVDTRPSARRPPVEARRVSPGTSRHISRQSPGLRSPAVLASLPAVRPDE
jgi:insertion element IS1 protein InsB